MELNPRLDADVGHDDPEVFLGDDRADEGLDTFDILLGDVDAGAGGRLEVDDELAWVCAREVGDPHERVESEAEEEDGEDSDHGADGTEEGPAECPVVAAEHGMEAGIEPPVQGVASVGVFPAVALDQLCTEERNDGERDDVGRKEGQDHGECQGAEEEPADTVEEGDGEEDDHGGEGRCQYRQRHLASAFLGGDFRGLTEFEVAEDVFEDHDRVVDESGEGEGEAPEDHGVDGVVAHGQRDKGGQRRQGDGEEHRDGGAHAAEEEQDHEAGQHEADGSLVDEVGNGVPDEDRLVEDDVGDEGFRDVDEVLEGGPDSIDDGDGVGIATLLENGEIDGALAVDTDQVVLDLGGILGFADVADEDGGISGGLERQAVHIGHIPELAVGIDVVVEVADADIACGEDEVGIVDRADDVHHRELGGFKLEGVDIDHDLAVLPAERLWDGCAGDIGDLVPDGVLPGVPELGFGHSLAFEGDEADGQAGGVELEDDRWEGAGRESAQVGGGEVGDGADRGVGIGSWLEVDLDEADARQGPAFDVVDSGSEGEEALEAASDGVFDLFRRHAGIERGHDDDRDADAGEEIDGKAQQGGDANHACDEAEDDRQVGISKGELCHLGWVR